MAVKGRVGVHRLASLAGGLALVVGGWWFAHIILGPRLVPAPWVVARVTGALIGSGELPLHALATLLRLAAAVLGSIVLAVPVGILAGTSRAVDRVVSPILYVLYPVPKIAFLPLFMVIFGLGNGAKIILLITVLFFQLAIAARDGVRTIPAELLDAAAILRLGRRERFRSLYLPSTLPALFSGLRVSVGIGIAVLFLAENYATRWGLGYFVMNTWSMVAYDRMFAGILALAVVAALVLTLIDMVERVTCPWTGSASAGS